MILAIKLGVTAIAIGMWLVTQKLLGRRKPLVNDRISDYVHILTEKYNLYLNQSPRIANGLLISSSLIVDGLGLFLIFQTLAGTSVRPLLALMVLFALRQINQATMILPTPQRMIWRNPGVPSLFVTYDVSNDLFFSGHTALAVLGALELAQLGGGFYLALAIAVVIFEVVTILLLRAHWTMDIFTGIITALWVHEVVSRYAPNVDHWIASF